MSASSARQNPHSAVGAVVLAAGSASRIGHRPKCLLELHGEPLIGRLLNALLENGIENIVVVLGHHAEFITPAVTKFAVTLVHNADPDAGQNTSLHCGLRALSNIDALLVALADQPLIDTEDIRDVLAAYRQRLATSEVLVPTVNDLPGNPVIFSAVVRDAILQRDNAYGCKQWQIENPTRVLRWPTVNEHYRVDIDTQDDIDALAHRTGISLRWPKTFS